MALIRAVILRPDKPPQDIEWYLPEDHVEEAGRRLREQTFIPLAKPAFEIVMRCPVDAEL